MLEDDRNAYPGSPRSAGIGRATLQPGSTSGLVGRESRLARLAGTLREGEDVSIDAMHESKSFRRDASEQGVVISIKGLDLLGRK